MVQAKSDDRKPTSIEKAHTKNCKSKHLSLYSVALRPMIREPQNAVGKLTINRLAVIDDDCFSTLVPFALIGRGYLLAQKSIKNQQTKHSSTQRPSNGSNRAKLSIRA